MMIWVGTTVVARIAATLRRFHVHCFTDRLLSREIQRQTTFLFHSRIVQTGHGNLKKQTNHLEFGCFYANQNDICIESKI